MATNRFDDRVLAATYADDPVVGVWDTDATDPDALWIPERLFLRLVHIGRAYELHTLPMLDGQDQIQLDLLRCQGLLDEVEFVASRLDDAAAIAIAQELVEYLAARIRRPGWTGCVTIEGE